MGGGGDMRGVKDFFKRGLRLRGGDVFRSIRRGNGDWRGMEGDEDVGEYYYMRRG